ncbi:MAG: NAD(P)/FAD-dependent oxidoreductase [bacterium]|jgi:kynurenine 3-monooxygenase
MSNKVLVIGAGLSGTLLAIRLAQRGMQVKLVEKRSDIRKMEFVGGRSINLALSDRGLKALRMVGLEEEVLKQCIPMKGRRIHPSGGEEFTSPYSGREGKHINSVSRGGLNILLLNKAESLDNLELQFDMPCDGVDLDRPAAHFKDREGNNIRISADYIFGADGSNSAVRQSMQERHHHLVFSLSQQYLSHAYKELSIPPSEGGGFRMEKNALHIWPRGGFMLIALPNLDGSFTVTLFLAHEGENSFKKLQTANDVKAFFTTHFPDAVPLMPTLVEDFFGHPTGLLATIKCDPWSANGKTLILGDAAHAIVPFYGQGMNASFEDVSVFDQMLDLNSGDLEKTIRSYGKQRKTDTDAIADLAIDNFYEMRDHVANPVFQRKRKIEMELEKKYPDYTSKYSMVTFNEDMPYARAMEKGREQDRMLMNVCEGISSVEELDISEVYKQLKKIQ